MRHLTGLCVHGLLIALALAGCSSGGGGGGNNSPSNQAPTANAGTNQTVAAGATVTLTGAGSTDSDGTVAQYTWTQSSGTPVVTLTGASTVSPTFIAPTLAAEATLTFSLVVRDNRGASSSTANVQIIVSAGVVNSLPTANAGVPQTVASGAAVTLTGAASTDADGVITQYAWIQSGGSPVVTLTNANTVSPTFTAPTVATDTSFSFSLVVTDDDGGVSVPHTVTLTVLAAVGGNVNVSGRVTFTRIPFGSGVNAGLDHANPTTPPARAIIVRALDSGTQVELATATTDADGNYTVSVPGGTSIIIEAVARMLRSNAVPLPRWDVIARDDDFVSTPYAFQGPAFSSGAGVTHNLVIPSGRNASGTANGTRHSAPFATLDTIYHGILTVLSVAPTITFPPLVIDWAAGNPGGQTFFNPNSNTIVLSADLASDTDEFDQHVIAHEFGHYLEFNFSRADNIGGSHGLGDRLDARVAFGEGFGYAFAAIVLGDPQAKDSGVFAGSQDLLSSFNVESNSVLNAGWFSEASVWSIVWDLYDGVADANDGVALGLAPLWSVLTGTQRTTTAMTSIFPFITALKLARPADAAAINTLVAAQGIVSSTMDAFATTETNTSGAPVINVLPVYANISANGTPVVVRSSDDFGTYNTLGNHRYLRLVLAAPQTLNITVVAGAGGSDPDVLVFRQGVLVDFSEAFGNEAFTMSNAAAGTYIFDVYECGNGCSSTGDSSGDFDITVTIN